MRFRFSSRIRSVAFALPFALALVLPLVPGSGELAGQAQEADQPFVEPPVPVQGPPIPRAPEVINRDDAGNATVRAIRLSEPLEMDGDLYEPVYDEVRPVSGFIQSVPNEGEPATELTEAWVLFDEENVYISARIHEEVRESEWVANDMRRDGNNIGNNENFGVVLDTYYDRRNGYFFYVNPLGGMADVQLTNEGSPNFDWNPVWDVQTGRFDGGWTVEMQIPFKSIRYRPGAAQVWGLQLRRGIQRKNEWSHLTLVSSSAAGTGRMGATRVSRAATLVGIEAPEVSFNVDVKPYGIGGLRTDLSAEPPTRNEEHGDWGVDLKWGVTENLTADFTYNTDFAQVEVDEQQVNLTRFSLFFPEKREFFLESRGIFDFPTVGAGSSGGGATPTLFFSRRIGLQGGEPVPIVAGGRLTGKVGSFDVGALGIRTDDLAEVGAATTDFTVLRLRRDVFSRSSVGALYARRSNSLRAAALQAGVGPGSAGSDGGEAGGGVGYNETYAADASLTFADDWYLSGYYSVTRTEGLPDSAPAGEIGESYQSRFTYDGDEQGLSAGYLVVEDGFNPEVGFLRRSGFAQSQLSARLSPRPESIGWLRQATLEGSLNYLTDHRDGFVETREVGGRLQLELESSDMVTVEYTDSYELLEDPFRIHEGVTIPTGRYPFASVQASYSFGPQRRISGRISAQVGDFYDGTLTSVGMGRGRVEISERLTLEPGVTWNRVELPYGDFDTWLSMARVIYSFTPRMFFTGLIQHNSSNDSFSTNVRLRWEYAPGSEIFVVYTEERDTDVLDRFSELSNRGLVVKATRLLRF